MKNTEIVNDLIRSANENGVVQALNAAFGKSINVSVPFSQKACETSIDSIDFSARAVNAMKRSGIFTVGDVIDRIANGELPRIRNLGKKTENEIKTRIMVFGYERLTENERKRFFYDVVDKNCSSGKNN